MDNTYSIAQRLAEFAPDALLVADEHGVICFANQTAVAMFRCPREELIGRSIDTLVPERLRERHAGHVQHFLREPGNREMGARLTDLHARRADGSEFTAGIRLAPLRIGERLYVAAAVRDVTEQRAIRDALIHAREEADRANRAKSRFLATASHDLRQPLQAIRLLNAAITKAAADVPGLRDLLAQQDLAIEGATRLLNSLLDISRLESGVVRPQWAPVPLQEIFEELRREFERSAAQKSLALQLPCTDLVLKTDPILFAQLLQNLLGNAIKYTERGHVRVSQWLEADSLVIEIEDTGVGIPSDKLERIFDEYYQLGPQGTQRLGVGLGLAIVREVSRLLSYAVEVDSALGRGTRVRVRIPRHALVATRPVPPREPAPARAPGPPPDCRVFLVEDNESVRKATQLFLSLEGYETASAGSAAAITPLIERMRPGDILICDYHLVGRQTGIDVLRHVRSALGFEIPAIFLSGDLQSMGQARKEPLARCRFLGKPVDIHLLLETMAELLAATPSRTDPDRHKS